MQWDNGEIMKDIVNKIRSGSKSIARGLSSFTLFPGQTSYSVSDSEYKVDSNPYLKESQKERVSKD